MTKSLFKNTFREIRNSKARFISIMAIIALGVGFFTGIKATTPSMYQLAEDYYKTQKLMDYRLLSTVGFDEDDISEIAKLDGVTNVMPSYFCDVLKSAEAGGDAVHLISVPTAYKDNEALNTVVVKEGRMPEKSGEILVEGSSFTSQQYKIGDRISFASVTGDTDVTTQLKRLEFTIVGKIESPLYISYQRGRTTVGNGKISDFMYILPENFAFEKYTELYVKTDASDNYSAFSDEYQTEIDSFKTALQDKGDERAEVFRVDVIEKARQELEDSRIEYDEEVLKANLEFVDAEQALKDGELEFEQKLADAQTTLDNALAQIESGRESLAQAKAEYNLKIADAEAAIGKNEAVLANSQNEYDKSYAEYKAQIEAAGLELDNGWQQYNAAYAEFKNVQEPQLLAGIEQAKATVEYLQKLASATADEPQPGDIFNQLLQAQATLDMLNAQYEQAVAALSQSKAELDVAQLEFDVQSKSGQEQLESAKQQLDAGYSQISAARVLLEAQRADGLNQLAAAQTELDSAQEQYDSGVIELERQRAEGEQALADSRTEYENKRAEADEKFAEARQKLDDAQKELDDLAEPEWYVYTRDDNAGYSTFSQNADRLDAVASVFPVFFLLVAVLVCLTTITRLIEEKRTEIGTLKALGYSNLSIIMKFVIYSMLAGVIGSVIGTVIGVSTMPFIIYNAYKTMYYIGDISLVLNIPSIVLGVGAALLCTAAVSVIVCYKSLHHKPASLMRPKSPKAGKRIFLEHITPLWRRMNFTSKLTARNLLRYKSRLFMTVIGVAGCSALIVAAFGLLNSFVPLTETQFDSIYKYDAVVVPKESGTEQELEYLIDVVAEDENVERYMLSVQEEATVTTDKTVKEDGIYLTVAQNPDEFENIISLHKRSDKTELELTDDGVLINEKLATELKLKVGDTIGISSDSGTADVVIKGIFEQYINNYICMTSTLYKKLYDKEIEYNILNVVLKSDDDETESSFSKHCLKDSRIVAVSYVASSIDDLKNMLNSLNMVAMVMIVCAAALAFVVLYNLTNINIAERVREIATFKVLGFYNRETSAYIYIENIVLTILGIAAGLILGIFLTGFIVQTIEVDNVMFGRDIFASSYLYAAGMTMLFSLIVLFAMSFKIKAVNMVESLKSVE